MESFDIGTFQRNFDGSTFHHQLQIPRAARKGLYVLRCVVAMIYVCTCCHILLHSNFPYWTFSYFTSRGGLRCIEMYWTKEKRNWGAIKMWSWAEPFAHYWQPACAWKWNKKILCLLYSLSLQNNGWFGLFSLHYITHIYISFIALQFLSIHKWCHTFYIWPTPLTIGGHTSYLSFFLHGQNFWIIEFTPKNTKSVKKTPLFRVKNVKNANFLR